MESYLWNNLAIALLKNVLLILFQTNQIFPNLQRILVYAKTVIHLSACRWIVLYCKSNFCILMQSRTGITNPQTSDLLVGALTIRIVLKFWLMLFSFSLRWQVKTRTTRRRETTSVLYAIIERNVICCVSHFSFNFIDRRFTLKAQWIKLLNFIKFSLRAFQNSITWN